MYNGMKGYIRLVCLFLLPIMLLLGSMEHGLRQIPNDYSFKSQRMINDGASFEFLVLGNSHAYLGVDPDQMGSVGFNAANISQDFRYDHMLLERYLERMPHLEHLFIPVSYGSLVTSLESGQESWRVKNYAIYMDLEPAHLRLGDHIELLNRPMRAQVKMLAEHLLDKKDNLVCSHSGAGRASPGEPVDLVADGKRAALRHTRAESASMVEAREHLEEIVALAKREGIRVHLFLPPAWSTYRTELNARHLTHVVTTCRALVDSRDGHL
ncbi:MAG: hypothetical protein IPN38_15265 [Flavobacteriales bacterium]|nr:hypothetical protein [Flavobacteriales bacterium]